jgi:hypothetical protein
MAGGPTPPPRAADDVIQDLQRSGWSRGTPRRASNILVPRMVGRAVGIHPVGSILALALGFQLGGIIGALFAVPLAGLLWVLVSTAVRAWRDKRIELQRTVDLTSLRRLLLALLRRAASVSARS